MFDDWTSDMVEDLYNSYVLGEAGIKKAGSTILKYMRLVHEIRELHVPNDPGCECCTQCHQCGGMWPCDTIQILDGAND